MYTSNNNINYNYRILSIRNLQIGRKNNNIEDNINKFNRLNEEVEKYKMLLEDVSLITINNDELNLKLNNIQEEIKTLNEEIATINDKIKQIS